ncbi:aldo-keto reductase family 1 member C1-like isoform 6-T6 [Callospermophilus lateralis]|uniref:aldo-keto reductase family 1 member C1-like n=1 Tax=Callospermophilus lateralis TaxID=76772 RepID=UPI004038E434
MDREMGSGVTSWAVEHKQHLLMYDTVDLFWSLFSWNIFSVFRKTQHSLFVVKITCEGRRQNSVCLASGVTAMDHKHQCVALNDGYFIPVLGFGTSVPDKVPKSEVIKATKLAIEAGFRHIDSAYIYQVEEEVGLAIKSKIEDGTVKREDIFYTSKLWSTFHKPDLVQPSLEQSLKKLQLDYVDLFLIHFPLPLQSGMSLLPKDEQGKAISEAVDLCDTWEAMEKCKDAGLTKSIGVSNFNCQHLEMILNKPGLKYKPVCNQVECHPFLNQRKLLDFCKSKDIVLVAYGAVGSTRDRWTDQNTPILLDDPVLGALAKKHNRTPALIALRYQLQRGVVALVKSFNEKRIKENMQVFEFQLTPEDMKILDDLNRNVRYYPVEDVFYGHPNYPHFDES